jgi:hypothetical protein
MAKETIKDRKEIVISAPNVNISEIEIVGTSDLVSNRFSAEVAQMLKDDMANNVTKAAKKERRKARDFAAEATASLYMSADGWHGMPANAFKSALVRAGQLAGVEMTLLKQCLFVHADGVDEAEQHVQLVRVHGTPEAFQVPTRTKGTVNISSRGRFAAGWRAVLRIEHEPAFISVQSVANLVMRAGKNVGIGAGRPMSSTSVGMGWGTFELA